MCIGVFFEILNFHFLVFFLPFVMFGTAEQVLVIIVGVEKDANNGPLSPHLLLSMPLQI